MNNVAEAAAIGAAAAGGGVGWAHHHAGDVHHHRNDGIMAGGDINQEQQSPAAFFHHHPHTQALFFGAAEPNGAATQNGANVVGESEEGWKPCFGSENFDPLLYATADGHNNHHQHSCAAAACQQIFFPAWGTEDLKLMEEMAASADMGLLYQWQMGGSGGHDGYFGGQEPTNWLGGQQLEEVALSNQQLPFQPYTNATKCKKSGNHIKRPMNAFMVWSREERLKICSVQPEKHNAEISKELGHRWRRMSKEGRRPYEEKAEELRQLHCLEYPDYKYRPRKKMRLKEQTKMEEGEGKQQKQYQQPFIAAPPLCPTAATTSAASLIMSGGTMSACARRTDSGGFQAFMDNNTMGASTDEKQTHLDGIGSSQQQFRPFADLSAAAYPIHGQQWHQLVNPLSISSMGSNHFLVGHTLPSTNRDHRNTLGELEAVKAYEQCQRQLPNVAAHAAQQEGWTNFY